MGTTFSVDYESLNALAGQLESIAGHLNQNDYRHEVDSRAVGDQRVAPALEEFMTDWTHGRRQIVEEVETTARILRHASTLYKDADDKVATASQGSAE